MGADRDEPDQLVRAFARNERWLRTVVVARSGDPAVADELMQEVALAVVRTENPPPEEVANAWLYRVAVRQALLHRRSLGRRRRLALAHRDNGHVPGESREPNPLDWLLADERRALVRRALEQLPPRDREVLLLKYTEDWDYRRIAEHTGASVSSVESRLHRARGRLRSRLSDLAAREETPASNTEATAGESTTTR